MNKDNLEYFIDANRQAFDSEEPGSQIWANIERKRRSSARISDIFTMRKMIACVLILVCGSAVLLTFEKRPARPFTGQTQAITTQDEFIDTVYQTEVTQMSTLVEIKQIELKRAGKTNPELYKNFMSSINQLTTSYNALKKEFNENPNKEKLLEAMIQNLKLQQELLSRQLSIFHTIKEQSHDKHSKNI